MITHKCKWCGNEFETYPYLVKQGYGKYCSLSCRSRGMVIEFPQKKKVKTPEDIQRKKAYQLEWARKHYKRHPRAKRENPTILCACGCGESLLKFSNHWYERKYIMGHQAKLYRKSGDRPPHHAIQHLSVWDKIRKAVYERDMWTCQECGKHCHDDIQCHHIIPYRISKDNSMDNLVTLCRKCHASIEHRYNQDETGNAIFKKAI